jgi:hypothetical protein
MAALVPHPPSAAKTCRLARPTMGSFIALCGVDKSGRPIGDALARRGGLTPRTCPSSLFGFVSGGWSMRGIRFVPTLCVAILAATVARAGMPVPVQTKCPVGGKTFTHISTASYSIWGYRPDGKPYGSWEFPIELARCPDNGLVIFDTFKPDEVKRLAELIRTDEYRGMLGQETNYYLAAWLMKALGRDPQSVAWMTVQASWQADGRPELKARYQRAYVDLIRALPKPAGDPTDWLILQGRAANGLRELGRFDEARAVLAALDLSPLDVTVPEQKTGAATPTGLGHQVLNFEEVRAAKRKRGFLGYMKDLKDLIDRRDPRSEPLRMIPKREAGERCKGGNDLSEDDRAFCASDAMKPVAPAG